MTDGTTREGGERRTGSERFGYTPPLLGTYTIKSFVMGRGRFIVVID